MTQKRLLSSKPAEAETSRWVFASCATPGVTALPKPIATRATTSRNGTIRSRIGVLLSYVSQLGIEVIAEPVAQEIQGEHGEHDGEPGEHRDPPGGDDELAPVGDHQAPGGQGPGQAGP